MSTGGLRHGGQAPSARSVLRRGRRARPAGLPLLAVILAAGVSAACCQASSSVTADAAGDAGLRVEEGEGHLEVTFGDGADMAVLSARAQPDGSLDLQLALDGGTVDGTYHPEGPRLHVDGHATALSAAERRLLQGFAKRLEMEWKPYATDLPLIRHLGFRLILLLSETPVGLELGEMDIDLPDD